MHRHRPIAALALLGACLAPVATSRPARADLAPPPDSKDSKRVPATIELDWSGIERHVSHRHVIATGETLHGIAAKLLGDASYAKAIVENNAATIQDADHIRAGDAIWLPAVASLPAVPKKAPAPPTSPKPPTPAPPPAPAAPPAADAAPTPGYDAFWVEPSGYHASSIVARASPGELPDARKKGATLAFVPHPVATKVLALLAKGPVVLTSLREGPAMPELKGVPTAYFFPDNLVHKEDPTVRIVTTYKLTGLEGGQVRMAADRVRYDAGNQIVTKEWVVPQPGSDRGTPRDETPPPPPPGGPAPMSDPAPAPTPAGMAAAQPPALAATSTPAAAVEDGHWPARTGLYVALGGAALVAALWAIRRRKASPTPPSAA